MMMIFLEFLDALHLGAVNASTAKDVLESFSFLDYEGSDWVRPALEKSHADELHLLHTRTKETAPTFELYSIPRSQKLHSSTSWDHSIRKQKGMEDSREKRFTWEL